MENQRTTAGNLPATYSELADFGRRVQSTGGRSTGQVANYQTALKTWWECHGRSRTTVVAGDFQAEYARLLDAYISRAQENLSSRTVKDRLEHLEWWRQLATKMQREDSLPPSFGDALRVGYERSGLTQRVLASEAGICVESMKRWLAGKGLPERNTLPAIERLELAMSLPPGSLVSRMPKTRRGQTAAPTTSFGKRMKDNLRQTGKFALPASDRLRDQWTQVIELKTDVSREGAKARNTWRLKTPDKVGIRVEWCMVLDGRVSVSAGIAYKQISRYLGFLALSRELGGRALPAPQLDTLAWLVRSDFVIAHIKWIRARSGGLRHNGLFNVLHNLGGLLQPNAGFLWLNPSIGKTLPVDVREEIGLDDRDFKTSWREACAAGWTRLREFERRLALEGKIEKSRDPKESLQEYIGSDFPLKELVRLVAAIESDPPDLRQKRSHAAWIRDVLLLKILIRHPLRVHHFSIMKFRGPGAHLKQAGTSWRLRFDIAEFKNAGSSAATDYEVTLAPELVAWLHKYLSEARPILYGANDCDFLFLPSQTAGAPRKPENEAGIAATGVWSTHGIYVRMKELTAHYSVSGLGLNPHGPRHIIATDHLRRNPREYAVVARMLNDKLETVIREYDHTEIEDGVRTISEGIELAERQLNLGTGRVGLRA